MSSMYSQQEYSILKISPELLENADAVVRKMHTKLVVEDIDKVVVHTTRIVTVFNANGEYFIDAYQHYDEGDGIEKQQAIILDARSPLEFSKAFDIADHTVSFSIRFA